MGPLNRLLASSKFLVILFACVLGGTLCALGKIPADELVKFVGALAAVLTLSIAHEDAAAKRNPGNIHNEGDTQ